MTKSHRIISPAILYWGTPVCLISSENEDGSTNVAPMSSIFWLGHHCMLGLLAESKTTQNMLRSKDCVLNLADDTMIDSVNALASTTGTEEPSLSKIGRGYRFVKDKWTCASLTAQQSDLVVPERVRECPVQMECRVVSTSSMMGDLPDRKGLILAVEVHVLRTYMLDELVMPSHPNRVNPDRWRPMIMSFQHLYGLGARRLGPSVLAANNEEKYRALTRSDVVEFPGDKDDELAVDDKAVVPEP